MIWGKVLYRFPHLTVQLSATSPRFDLTIENLKLMCKKRGYQTHASP